MLEDLKQIVWQTNMDLVKYGLVIFTWGNVSGIDRDKGLVAIKPSGLAYEDMAPEDICIVDMDGKLVEGKFRPSSDTGTHLEIYKAFENVGGVVHTHSEYATSWAQAQRDLKICGTTHGDSFYGDVPCTRAMTDAEINIGDYEENTGKVIAECFAQRKLNPEYMPAVLVANHGPFTWGKDAFEALHNSVILESVAKMAFVTHSLNPNMPMNNLLTEKHFMRKHGPNAYYGQSK